MNFLTEKSGQCILNIGLLLLEAPLLHPFML